MKQFLNVHGRLCKVAFVALALMFMTSFAQVSLNVGIDARIRGVLNSGTDAIRSEYYDTGKVTLAATIDNVTATVQLSRASDSSTGATYGTTAQAMGNFLYFSWFTLEVKDLFSGLLSAKFYNWGFGAGSSKIDGNQLLSDIDLVGAYFDVQPIDIFGFGFGYGVHGLVESGEGRNTAHAIKFNAKVGGPVPVNVYFGTVLTHGFTATLAPAQTNRTAVPANPATVTPAVTALTATPVTTRTRPFGVERMQVGVDADFYQGWIKASVGFTLPIGTAVSYIKSPTDTAVGRDFILIGGVDGSIPFGDTGLALDYAAYYVTQSFAKDLPNALDKDLHDSFDGVQFKARVKPKYSLGIFGVALQVDVFTEEKWDDAVMPTFNLNTQAGRDARDALVRTLVNNLVDAGVANDDDGGELVHSTLNNGALTGVSTGTVDGYVKPTTGPRNPLGIALEPTISITFAPGMSVDLLYALSMTELSDREEGVDSATVTHTVGMNVKAAFGYTAE